MTVITINPDCLRVIEGITMYSIKEAFYSLQGEGAHTGRPAIFCRFTGCNLWTGKEKHRASAKCQFCDTDFIGTDGQNGGKFKTAEALIEHLDTLWPEQTSHKYLIFTGGEPALQLDEALIAAAKASHYTLAIETNGTLPLPDGIDWICVSPKTAEPSEITPTRLPLPVYRAISKFGALKNSGPSISEFIFRRPCELTPMTYFPNKHEVVRPFDIFLKYLSNSKKNGEQECT